MIYKTGKSKTPCPIVKGTICVKEFGCFLVLSLGSLVVYQFKKFSSLLMKARVIVLGSSLGACHPQMEPVLGPGPKFSLFYPSNEREIRKSLGKRGVSSQ